MVNETPRKKNKIGFLYFLLAAVIVFWGFFFLQKTKEINIFSQKEPPASCSSSLCSSPDVEQLSWQEVLPSAPWSGRDAHSTIVFKDKIWLFGGVEGSSMKKSPQYEEMPHKNDIWVSQDGKNWELVKEKAEWGERRSMATVVFKDKIWLLGGWTPKWGETKNDIWVSEDGINWNLAANKAPWSPREGHTVLVFNNKIWVAGGVDFYKREVKNDVWSSEDGIHWTEVNSRAPWSPRYDHTLTVFKDKLWLLGGLYFGNDVKKDTWVSEDGENWKLVTDIPPWISRHGHVSLEYKDKLWIIGGWSEDVNKGLNDTWYSEDGYNWKKTKLDGPWLGREDHTALVFNDKIWLIGGMADNKDYWLWKNDIWQSSF